MRLQADMQPIQLRAIPSPGSLPGQICLVPERATRRVALQMSVQAAKQLQNAGEPPLRTGPGSTASGTSADVRAFCRMQDCACSNDIICSACMRAASFASTDATLVFSTQTRLACFEALLKSWRGQYIAFIGGSDRCAAHTGVLAIPVWRRLHRRGAHERLCLRALPPAVLQL